KDGSLNLSQLVAGSEGTLAYVTKVKLALVERPKATRLMILHFEGLPQALEQVPPLLKHKVAAVELMTYPLLKLADDHPFFSPRLRKFVHGLPGAILIVEFAGRTGKAVAAEAETLEKNLLAEGYNNHITHCIDNQSINRVWEIRKSVLGLLMSRPTGPRRTSIIDDPTVPVEEMKDFTREVIEAGKKFGLSINFDAHASAGCLHMSPVIDLKTHEGVKLLEQFSRKIVDIAVSHHGTSTGEHGDGIARSYFIERVYGRTLNQAFKEVKTAFDPQGCLNPDKKVNPIKPWDTDWFRYYPGYFRPYAPQNTFFNYEPYDGFTGLVEMCNGTGTCRSRVSGTMCPSYRVTGEELHTTRGRANALRAAINGEFGPNGITDPKLHEALDLCVECKACRNECPTRVDMAKLKYEFLAQYHAKHGVPLRSRLFANLERTDRLGRLAPGLTNRIFNNRAFRRLLDRTLGVDERRELPGLSETTFQKWFHSRNPDGRQDKKTVILWDDCHLSQHQPELGMAAVAVLEAAGFRVHLIRQKRCCGRPMISKGLLSQARANARRNVALLAPWADKGVPIVGVEPSCIACFQDEYPDLLSSAEADKMAENSFFIETFLTGLAREEKLHLEFNTSAIPRKIFVHTHCYQKAFGTAEEVLAMLRLMPGVSVEEISSGCCGMAGAFGYEKEHYEFSMAMGEQALFPAVRSAPDDTVIAAAGTSCRQQIKDGTQRKARHPILILADALKK
ncbi:MAG: 4Fe-4S dicluster domain-containing protein, partial [Desulfobacteraceae bacterium]|nr:4Fe-4S dicluster domain-containing protein [Desulfobacteraceae bacterium]